MLPIGQRCPDPIQVTGNLCNGILHEFGSWGLISEEKFRPPTGLFPNLMTGQSHVGPNRPSAAIEVPVPPSRYSRCTRHHCTIGSRRRVTHDERLKNTSGPDGRVQPEDELRFLRNRFTRQWEHPGNARRREHDPRRCDYRTLLGKASGGGRETVQIAGLERCLWRSSRARESVMGA